MNTAERGSLGEAGFALARQFCLSALRDLCRSWSAKRFSRPYHAPGQGDFSTSIMNKLCIFVGMFVVSTAVGLGADALGCSFFTSFLLSGVGAMVGVWLGWVVHRRYFF